MFSSGYEQWIGMCDAMLLLCVSNASKGYTVQYDAYMMARDARVRAHIKPAERFDSTLRVRVKILHIENLLNAVVSTFTVCLSTTHLHAI